MSSPRPTSSKVYVTGSRPDLRVPMREVSLSNGETAVRLYDTSGPWTDPAVRPEATRGLPPLRRPWILGRGDVEPSPAGRLRARAGRRVTQLHYARRGEITSEMEFVALREGVAPELVRDEVARGRAIIPASVNHPRPSRWSSAGASW